MNMATKTGKKDKTPRDVPLQIRLTEEEKTMFTEAAERDHLSLSHGCGWRDSRYRESAQAGRVALRRDEWPRRTAKREICGLRNERLNWNTISAETVIGDDSIGRA